MTRAILNLIEGGAFLGLSCTRLKALEPQHFSTGKYHMTHIHTPPLSSAKLGLKAEGERK